MSEPAKRADVTVVTGSGSPARPQMIRAMNEQLLLDHIRAADGISRADLARISGLAKNTVSLALANLERARLVRVSGVRTGLPGPAAVLYEVRPESGFVLALDVGSEFLRGAIQNIAGTVLARRSVRAQASTGPGRVGELVALSQLLLAEADLTAADITQTVLGSPGIHDPRRTALVLAGALPGWDQPAVLTELRRAFGPSLMIENDVDAAALAERAHGHGQDVDNFAFVSVGTGIGMGLVIGGRLHRGSHGAAGEIGYLPLDEVPDEPAPLRFAQIGAAASSAHSEAATSSAHPKATASSAHSKAATSSAHSEAATGEPRARVDTLSDDSSDTDDGDVAARVGSLEVTASAAGIVRAALAAGMTGPLSARDVFEAADKGDERAATVVAAEALLVARAVCAVITVADPELIVLGGGVGQAAGFVDAVGWHVRRLAPVRPSLKVSALGDDAVVDGCLAAGLDRAWQIVTGPLLA